MEEHKWRYVNVFSIERQTWKHPWMIVLRPSRRWNIWSTYVHACYDEEESSFANDEFLKMILVNGCFTFETFLKYSIMSLRRRNDPVFITPGMLFDLRSNMMLLENQIPLFILRRLFKWFKFLNMQCTHSLTELAFRFFKHMVPGDPRIHQQKFNQEGYHILDLTCHCLLPTHTQRKPREPSQIRNIYVAQQKYSKLQELGSRGPEQKTYWTESLSAEFEIPPAIINQYTMSLLASHCTGALFE